MAIPMVEGQTRMAARKVCGRCVLLQLRGAHRERVREALQDREHLFRRKQVFHRHEAHEVQPASGLPVGVARTAA